MENTYPFKGKFKDLKSKGYRFWKAYAWNYKVYTKYISPAQSINVWVAHGGYIEYGDLYGHTANFFEALKNLRDEDFEKDRVYIVFEWDDYNVKPQIHKMSRDIRAMKLTKEKYPEEFMSKDKDVYFDAWEKALNELDGGKHMREIVIYKETRDLILQELKLINS